MHKGTTSPKIILATQRHIADKYGDTTRKLQICTLTNSEWIEKPNTQDYVVVFIVQQNKTDTK